MRDFPGKSALQPWVLAARRFRAGELRLADLAYGHPTFSQFGEDRVLEHLLGDRVDGFYVDVGAYAPHHASNTYLLYRRGWHGINLEPDPRARREIERARPRDLTLGVAASDVAGSVDFVLAGAFSGINDHTRLWSDVGQHIEVPRRRLADVLDEHLPTGRQVDFLDVDCEGHDLAVLRGNDWERYRPRVVLAEVHGSSEVVEYLVERDYELYGRVGPSAIFVEGQSSSRGPTDPPA